MSAIEVLLVGRHLLSVAGFRALIDRESDLTVVRQIEPESVASIGLPQPVDVAVIDGTDCDPLEVITAIKRSDPETPSLLVLSGSSDEELLSRAFRAGASGFVSKRQAPGVLIRAIREVHAGEVWLKRSLVAGVINNLLQPHPQPGQAGDHCGETYLSLSGRDRRIVVLVAKGLNNRQIAEELGVSESTVRNRLTSVYRNVGVSGRFPLVMYAHQHGLIARPVTDRGGETVHLRLV